MSGRESQRHDIDSYKQKHPGVRIINVSESLDGVIILRNSDPSHKSSKISILEELNPRKLYLKEIKETREVPERRLSFSRHYSAKRSRSNSGNQRQSRSAEFFRHQRNREIVADVPRPELLSKQLRDHLVPFVDSNRTPTPASHIAEHMLEEARHKRNNQ